jgi:hypothetical protein
MLKDEIQQPVFVKIIELTEKSERRRFSHVRSIVWLRSFDPGLRLDAKVSQLPSGHLLGERVGRVADRELETSSIWRRIKPIIFSNGHRIDSSIERGSEIVDTVACDQGPSLKPRLRPNLQDKSVAGTISVRLPPRLTQRVKTLLAVR